MSGTFSAINLLLLKKCSVRVTLLPKVGTVSVSVVSSKMKVVVIHKC